MTSEVNYISQFGEKMFFLSFSGPKIKIAGRGYRDFCGIDRAVLRTVIQNSPIATRSSAKGTTSRERREGNS
jgi:hypothetical protein